MPTTPKSKNVEKESRLSNAAEALVEAALLDAGTASQKELASQLETLQISLDNKLNTVIQTQKASDQNFGNKINTLNQHLVELKKDMSMISSSIQEEKKQKTLERALSLTDVHQFQYYHEDTCKLISSSHLAKIAIKSFMLDHGRYLPNASLAQRFSREATDEETKEFRYHFKAQIKALIKREPRLEKESDGNFAIYYS